jgi:CRISPR-associated endoribonuclease Cas6
MRIELTLENTRPETTVPVNYNHYLASCVYQLLKASSPAYALRLHQEGYAFQGKRFKLFTFSQLFAAERRIARDRLIIRSPTLRWLIASPVDEFVMHFADGILDRGVVRVGDAAFRVRAVQALPTPAFAPVMRFTCLSPMTISTHTEAAGRHPLQYCRLEDGFYEKVVANLCRKYRLLTGHDAGQLDLSLAFDPDYVAKRGGQIHKTIQYKNTRIFAYLAPFTAQGAVELMRVGYECGFGDGNSKGFGMVGVGRKE